MRHADAASQRFTDGLDSGIASPGDEEGNGDAMGVA